MERGFKIEKTTVKKLLQNYVLDIPDFQRKLVWNKVKKIQLIESLLKGFPIGAMTLFDEKNRYLIIDGLQRINTLKEYLRKPSAIVSTFEFNGNIKKSLEEYLQKSNLNAKQKIIVKRSIKTWYESLDELYIYEKMTVLYKIMENEKLLETYIEDIDKVFELHKLLMKEIAIHDEEIAIIIYQGSKDDLPDLFKNINTGSVVLSQYEILQSLWINYTLNKENFDKYYKAYIDELNSIKYEYEIAEVKSEGNFDIFKCIVGLNSLICRIEKCNLLFIGWKRVYTDSKDETKKIFENESIGFEIYSLFLKGTTNKISSSIDDLFNDEKYELDNNIYNKREIFILKLNDIILEYIGRTIEILENLEKKELKPNNSKYHSLYILCGNILSDYIIDSSNLIIKKISQNTRIYEKSNNLKLQLDEKWFVDENRQLKFFSKKIQELYDMQNENIDD